MINSTMLWGKSEEDLGDLDWKIYQRLMGYSDGILENTNAERNVNNGDLECKILEGNKELRFEEDSYM